MVPEQVDVTPLAGVGVQALAGVACADDEPITIREVEESSAAANNVFTPETDEDVPERLIAVDP